MASTRSFALIVMLVAVLQLLAPSAMAQNAQQAAGAAAQQQVPQACIEASVAIQGACSSELSGVLRSQGVNANTNDVGSVVSATQQLVAQGKADQAINAFNPSAGCCKAACEFTRRLCGCNDNVVRLASQAIGADAATTGRVLNAFASKCKFPALSRATGNCPATASFTC